MNGLTPTEQAEAARRIAETVARMSDLVLHEEQELVSEMTATILDRLAGRGLDLDHEDVQFYAGVPGVNLDMMQAPLEDAFRNGWEEQHPVFGTVTMLPLTESQALSELAFQVKAIDGDKPWFTQVSREAELKCALRSRVGWQRASKVGLAAWRESRKPKMKPALRTITVSTATADGLQADSGTFIRWSELQDYSVMFKTKDGGPTLYAAIMERLKDNREAVDWAQTALKGH
jgi:hypothetical protein